MNDAARQPTPQERARERALWYPNIADAGMISLLTVTAIATGSVTIFSEALRGAIQWVVNIYSAGVMAAQHRGRLEYYQFGVGKIEQLVWVAVGVALLIGVVWVVDAAMDVVFSTGPTISPLGLAAAAIVNAINLVLNSLGLLAMYASSENRESGVFGAQVRARLGMVLVTLVLQVTLTVAALARDADIAVALDLVGAAIVVYIKISMGIGMIRKGLPSLLDAPADDAFADELRRATEIIVGKENLATVRTRRSGETTYAQVALAPTARLTARDLSAMSERLHRELGELWTDLDLSVVVAAETASGHSA